MSTRRRLSNSNSTNVNRVYQWDAAPEPWNTLGPEIAKQLRAEISRGARPGSVGPLACKICGEGPFADRSGLQAHIRWRHRWWR